MGSVHDPRWDHIDGPTVGAETLPRAVRVVHAGHWDAAAQVDTISLVFDARHRRRIRMTTDTGRAFLLDLPKAHALCHGDGLDLADGSGIIQVRAAPEPLMAVHASDPKHLLRMAWHIGNRHLPAMLTADTIMIRPDHVIRDMLQGLGGTVQDITAPFQPEGGAYTSHGVHDHDH